ncbi:hypothetical protein [Microcystis phage Mel-JY34]
MTIDDVMRLAREASHKRATEANWHGLRAAILALIDAEAEACAEIVMAEQATPHGAAYCEAAIRARIAARKTKENAK